MDSITGAICPMAHINANTPQLANLAQRLLQAATTVARGFGSMMLTAQNRSKIAQEVEALNAKSEAQLRDEGKTRSGEIDRIFAAYAHL
jgi:hypothetical protein